MASFLVSVLAYLAWGASVLHFFATGRERYALLSVPAFVVGFLPENFVWLWTNVIDPVANVSLVSSTTPAWLDWLTHDLSGLAVRAAILGAVLAYNERFARLDASLKTTAR